MVPGKKIYKSTEKERTPRINLTEMISVSSVMADEIIERFITESCAKPREEIARYISSHFNGCRVDRRVSYD